MNPGAPKRVRTRVIVLFAITCNVLGNFSISRGMHDLGAVVSLSPLPYIHALFHPWVLAGVGLLIAWIVAQLTLLSRADLTYVLPVTASAYVLDAMLGRLFLGDVVSQARWGGVFLITAGVVLVGQTAPRTSTVPPAVHIPAVVYPPLVDERPGHLPGAEPDRTEAGS